MVGAYSIGLTAIVVAVVIALNLLVGQLPATFTKLDSSGDGVLTITADTKNLLKGIKDDITVYHIITDENEDASVSALLERYEDASSRIKVKTVDPVDDPKFTLKYTESQISDNSLIIESSKRSIVVDYNDFYLYEIEGMEGTYYSYEEYYSYAQQMYYYSGQSVGCTEYFFAENEITRALDYVTHDTLPVVYELTGHGEASVASSSYGSLIADENVELKTLELIKGDEVKVPEDSSALIISTPTADISELEKDALISYLNRGGNIILFTYFEAVGTEKMPNLSAVCDHMGLSAIPELIMENDQAGYYQSPYYLIPSVTGKGITSSLSSSNLYTFMVGCHAISATGDGENVSVAPLFETTKSAYIYTEEAAKDPDKAEKQQFSVAYQSTVSDEEGNEKGTLYWFACPDFLNDSFSKYGNSLVFTAIITKTCDKPSSISIIGKEITNSYLQLTENAVSVWSAVVIGIIPAVTLIIGLVIWIRRRTR